MDWDSRRDAGCLEPFVGSDPFAERGIEKCQMIEAGAALGLLDQSRHLGEGDTMMLFVVGHEDQKIVLVHNLGVEYSLIPVDHFLQPGGAKHGMRKLRG